MVDGGARTALRLCMNGWGVLYHTTRPPCACTPSALTTFFTTMAAAAAAPPPHPIPAFGTTTSAGGGLHEFDRGRDYPHMADGSLAAVGGRIQDVDTLRMMYFGLPSNPDPSYNQYGRMSDTYKTFPQAWGGPYATQSPHISNVLIHKLSKTDDLMLNELMPLRVAPDGPTKFAITLIEYNSNRWTNG